MKRSFPVLCVFLFLLSSCGSTIPQFNNDNNDLSIHDIQGCSHISPFNGKEVDNVLGIVTWKKANGFFMQESLPDEKECSSEGIFVFTDQYPSAIPGDKVSVDGKVSEFTPGAKSDNNLSVTEIISKNYSILSTGNNLPAAIKIGSDGRLPPDKTIDDDHFTSFDEEEDGIDFYESLEGMLVEVDPALVVEPTNSYNEIFVIPEESVNNNIISKQGALLSTIDDQNPERILIQLPEGYWKSIHLGDTIDQPITGVMDYEYGNYRLLEIDLPSVTHHKVVVSTISRSTDQDVIRIATYNINNYSRFDENKVGALADEVVNDLGAPDILVFQEVQDDSGPTDDGTTSAEKNLNALAERIYKDDQIMYRYIDSPPSNNTSGGAEGGNIRSVFFYRADLGLDVKKADLNWNSGSSAFNNSRIPTSAKFTFKGHDFYLIGVHLVSNTMNTPLYGSVQPPSKPEEEKRIEQAKWLAGVVNTIQEKEPNSLVVVAGDFNDIPESTTLHEFDQAEMVNTADQVPENERFSILYEGNASLFDQILISKNMEQFLDDTYIIHINTPQMEEKQTSDHDPYVIDLRIKN